MKEPLCPWSPEPRHQLPKGLMQGNCITGKLPREATEWEQELETSFMAFSLYLVTTKEGGVPNLDPFNLLQHWPLHLVLSNPPLSIPSISIPRAHNEVHCLL